MYFSRTEGLILKDNLNGSEKTKLATTTMQTAGWQSVLDGQDEELGFYERLLWIIREITDTECILFFLLGFMCLVPSAEALPVHTLTYLLP